MSKTGARLETSLRDDVREADIEAVREIVASSGFFAPYEIDIAVELVQERLTRGVASGYYFVFADVEDRTVGYACYGPIGCTLGSYDLYWIAVRDACRGCGVGVKLLREVERRIAEEKGRRIYVETSSRPLYEPTRRFYEKAGYAVEAVLEDFYSPGDAKVIFSRAVES